MNGHLKLFNFTVHCYQTFVSKKGRNLFDIRCINPWNYYDLIEDYVPNVRKI